MLCTSSSSQSAGWLNRHREEKRYLVLFVIELKTHTYISPVRLKANIKRRERLGGLLNFF